MVKLREKSSTIQESAQDGASSLQSDTSVEAEPRHDGLSDIILETLCVEPDAAASAKELIRRSVVKHFPSPPLADGGGVLTPELLEEHLCKVKRVVHDELQRVNQLRKENEKLAGLVPSYHRHTLHHVDTLLQNISSSRQAFVLMEWLCDTYFSEGFLGNPDFSENKHRSPVDMQSYSETVVRVRKTLLTTLETDVRRSLDGVFQHQESEFWRSWKLHKDVIQCINEPIVKAKAISENMQERVWCVCFVQLQEFLQRFKVAKKNLLERYKNNHEVVVETCIKTHNTCQGLVKYIKTNTDGGTSTTLSLERVLEALESLESLEMAAQTSMGDAFVKITKDLLKTHFKTSDDHLLSKDMKEKFEEMVSAEDCDPDVQKSVVDLVYERLSALYLWKLVSTKRGDLEKRWCQDVGQKVTCDADQLHQIFSALHADVSQQNRVLLKVEELLGRQDVDSVKLILSEMIKLCQKEKIKKLLPDLLRWKGGLSRRELHEVLEAVPGLSP